MTDDLINLFPRAADVPERHRLAGPENQTEYLSDGKLLSWAGPQEDVYSPVCIRDGDKLERQLLGRTPRLTETESLAAADAAARAWDRGRGAWPTMTVAERIAHLEEFAFLMKARQGEVVRLLMWEVGKSFPDSDKEFTRTLAYIQDTIDALKDLDRASSRFSVVEGVIAQVRRAPLGVVLCMGPFNYPLNETYTILIPALIMGNTVVMKPPKCGVLLHRPILEAMQQAFPPGVVNVVYGEGSSLIGPVMKSGRINALGFIGSCGVADLLKSQHPEPHRLRSVLGLGAKNPAIILPDADLDLAAKECALGSLSFNGQRCTAIKIIFVHRKIADKFLERFCAEVAGLKWGMPWEEGVKITPLALPGKPEFFGELVDEAKKSGAEVVNPGGGRALASFFTPAVVYPVNSAMRLYHKEQFGPVVPVAPFDDPEEAVRWVEDSHYGQQVSLFGSDPDALAGLIDHLVNQVCRVNLNCQCQRGPDVFPFTGRKDSAEGTLSVSDALRVFSIRTLFAAKEMPRNQEIIEGIVRGRKSKFLSTDFIF